MPSIVYTPQQQALIDAANLAIKNATDAQLAALTARENEWNGNATNSTKYSVLSWITELQKCSGSNYISRNANGDITAASATQGSCSKNTFNDRNAAFKIAVGVYSQRQDAYLAAQAALKKANDNFTALMNDLSKDPNIISQQTVISQAAATAGSVLKSKWVIFGIIVVVVIVAILLVIRMTK